MEWRTVLGAAIAASGLIVAAASAQAHDDDWRWDHRHHEHGYWHREPERRVVVEREVVERRPVYVAPAPQPILVAPMAPAYGGGGYGGPPSLNLNFNIPLR
jgi:hypothetical protein